jgi:hypothetical protein
MSGLEYGAVVRGCAGALVCLVVHLWCQQNTLGMITCQCRMFYVSVLMCVDVASTLGRLFFVWAGTAMMQVSDDAGSGGRGQVHHWDARA